MINLHKTLGIKLLLPLQCNAGQFESAPLLSNVQLCRAIYYSTIWSMTLELQLGVCLVCFSCFIWCGLVFWTQQKMSDEEEYVCTMDPKCLWNPADSEIRTTNMDRLRKKIEGKYDVKLSTSIIIIFCLLIHTSNYIS